MYKFIKFIKEQDLGLWISFNIFIPLLGLVLILALPLPKIIGQIAIFTTLYLFGFIGLPMILKKEIKFSRYLIKGSLIPILGYFILITIWGLTTFALLLQILH